MSGLRRPLLSLDKLSKVSDLIGGLNHLMIAINPLENKAIATISVNEKYRERNHRRKYFLPPRCLFSPFAAGGVERGANENPCKIYIFHYRF